MRRLWVQLSLAFSAMALISAVLLFVLIESYASSRRQALTDDTNASNYEDLLYGEQGFVTQLQMHLADGGTLDQATILLDELTSEQSTRPFRLDFRLIAPTGEIVYEHSPPDLAYEQISLDGAIFEFRFASSSGSRPQSDVLPPQILLIFLAIVGTMMSVLFSVVLGRRLATPLSQLADTVRQFGGHDFSLRVQPRGSEEMRNVAHAFNEMATRLEDSEQLRNNLVADVAHELRTPLTVMSNNLRALIDDVHPLTKSEVFTLYDQTQHLSHLVNDLHELSLADAHELTLVHEPLVINELLHSIAEIFKPVAEAEDIFFAVSVPEEPLRVNGDRIRLNQVTQNLLVNALRYTPSGGEITIRLEQRGRQVCLQVIDTGEGIPTEHLAHIFERFYRADRSRDRASGGTGLGLAIGKAIIEAHGGKITVNSNTTKPSGTSFTILLPLNHNNHVTESM